MRANDLARGVLHNLRHGGDHVSGNRIVRAPECVRLTGLSDSTLRRLEQAGEFPIRRRLGPRSRGWLLSEIEAWLRSREARK